MKISNLKMLLKILSGVIICCVGFYSIGIRLPQCFNNQDAIIVAAALTMSKGSYDFNNKVNITTANSPKSIESNKKSLTVESDSSERIDTSGEKKSSDFSEDYYNSYKNHKGAEKYPIYSQLYTGVGDKYDCFYIKNSTDYQLNIKEMINKDLGFTFENNDDVQVLIYHTHTGESYIDCDLGYYYSDYYPRTTDNRYNVVKVGEEITKELKKAGIGVVHDKTIHDTSYNGSYSRSRATVEKNLEKYPDIKVTIDIHRDSIGNDEYKMKPTFTYNGKKGAQIMIMSGYDPSGYLDFPNWKENLTFALKLNQMCEKNYKGMTRPLYFGNFAYNMNINSGSLLIEVGTDANTLDEAVYSGNLLGKALSQVLQNSK